MQGSMAAETALRAMLAGAGALPWGPQEHPSALPPCQGSWVFVNRERGQGGPTLKGEEGKPVPETISTSD